ncbi:hypothetical protein Misp01_53150 [Microtetraspora sp. NBRC 13810]|uniref:hypothetical protein n=1 Tax=Microtetraspora sp. NBRC 13810 TaxID=3030990 RepID=UPI00255391EC|nr:hypothetical protein [Microtetraspora sp. NBRC 13810]GLW10186.1 hypothetical protein Misp01_53150 [Microtetraspora sp. NBRC 13810]
MVDASILTTMISTGGVILGALSAFGGVTLTNRANLRKEERQAERQQEERREQECHQAFAELLAGAARLRMQVEIAAQRPWVDMNAHLNSIQEQAALVLTHAYQVALLRPGVVGTAARNLGAEGSDLTGKVVRSTRLDYDHDTGELRSGEITTVPDFGLLDQRIAEFYTAAAGKAAIDPPSVVAAGLDGGKPKGHVTLRR